MIDDGTSASPYPRDLPPFWLVASLCAMVLLHFCWPLHVLWRAPWTWLGVAVILVGLWPMIWAAGLFRRAGTGVRPFTAATALVAAGPYRFTRNPMYLGMVTVTVGAAICLGSASPWVVPPAFAILIDRRFVRREEEFLRRELGEPYVAFCTRVRRWL
jgi:protein-S-isoprenylcysteine O-methyltransferase Ste14